MKEMVSAGTKCFILGLVYGAGIKIGWECAKPIGNKIAEKISDKLNKRLKRKTGD